MEDAAVHAGGCLCGGVRYEAAGILRDVVVCHCSRCRRSHGHVGAYTSCPAAALRIVRDRTLRWYAADGRERGFCERCGGSVFWRTTGSETVSIAAGTLDPPTGLRTVAHIHTRDRGDYYDPPTDGRVLPGGLPPRP